MDTLDNMELARNVAQFIYEKKGGDIIILDLDKKSIVCDYFVIACGDSQVHNRAIAEYVVSAMKEKAPEYRPKIHGKNEGGWVLIDFGSVVAHIFLQNFREFYDLEGLWKGAPVLRPEFVQPVLSRIKEEV